MRNLVIWLPAIFSSLFTVSIDTSVGLVLSQKSLFTGCAANISSTDPKTPKPHVAVIIVDLGVFYDIDESGGREKRERSEYIDRRVEDCLLLIR